MQRRTSLMQCPCPFLCVPKASRGSRVSWRRDAVKHCGPQRPASDVLGCQGLGGGGGSSTKGRNREQQREVWTHPREARRDQRPQTSHMRRRDQAGFQGHQIQCPVSLSRSPQKCTCLAVISERRREKSRNPEALSQKDLRQHGLAYLTGC